MMNFVSASHLLSPERAEMAHTDVLSDLQADVLPCVSF